jgi:23S rRNA (uracil1939-C5)-methyltransferase
LAQFTFEISRLGGLGDGSGTYEDSQYFVPKSTVGDILKVNTTDSQGGQRRAEIVEIVKAGPNRVAAPCPHFTACGGCALQHLDHDAYQNFKKSIVTTALGYGGFPEVEPIIHFLPANTRRRTEFKIENRQLAYVAAKSHTKVPINSCLILIPELQALIKPINKMLPKFPHVTGVSISMTDTGIDMLLQLASSDGGLSYYKPFLDTLPLARVSIQWPSKSIQMLDQKEMILMRLGNHDVPIPADAFLQASSEAQKIITDLVVKAVTGTSPIVDLFCGMGTYSFPMSDNRARVHAVDNNGPMIDHMKGISPQVSVQKRDLFLNPLTTEELKKYKAAVINPPRMGAAAQIKHLAASGIPKIVMVSCNHSTWSRDAKALKTAGYNLQSLTAIDQFVYSPHVEIVSVFSR